MDDNGYIVIGTNMAISSRDIATGFIYHIRIRFMSGLYIVLHFLHYLDMS